MLVMRGDTQHDIGKYYDGRSDVVWDETAFHKHIIITRESLGWIFTYLTLCTTDATDIS